MIIVPEIPFRFRRPRRQQPQGAAPLELLSGVYVSAASVRLTFDRAINIAAISTGAIIVNDNDDVGEKFEGQGAATLLAPETVEIGLVPAGGPSGTGITLTASAANGIVAVDDGGTWVGVTDFALSVP
jgi:hypothetical protein